MEHIDIQLSGKKNFDMSPQFNYFLYLRKRELKLSIIYMRIASGIIHGKLQACLIIDGYETDKGFKGGNINVTMNNNLIVKRDEEIIFAFRQKNGVNKKFVEYRAKSCHDSNSSDSIYLVDLKHYRENMYQTRSIVL